LTNKRKRHRKSSKQWQNYLILLASAAATMIIGLAVSGLIGLRRNIAANQLPQLTIQKNCPTQIKPEPPPNLYTPFSISIKKEQRRAICYPIKAIASQNLAIYTNDQIQISTLDSPEQISVLADYQYEIPENGTYFLIIMPGIRNELATIKINLVNATIGAGNDKTTMPPTYSNPLLTKPQPRQPPPPTNTLTYNSIHQPSFRPSQELQNIVRQAVEQTANQGLPIANLSISLVNLSSNADSTSCCTYAGYQDLEPRFPASVAKLFWVVALFGYTNAGKLDNNVLNEIDLYAMMQDSDNNPASQVLDQLTDTHSEPELPNPEIKEWIDKRKSINGFFTRAGYRNLNISQKNFPIPAENLDEPVGSDRQIRGDPSTPQRNYLTTHDTARLLYEIYFGQAISLKHSEQILTLLERNYAKEKQKEYDSIRGFLGEGLNANTARIFSKVGWTSGSRQDAAIVWSDNGSVQYILVIFGDSPEFASDWDIFPQLSRLIYDYMRECQEQGCSS
jgi:hypothetical protein